MSEIHESSKPFLPGSFPSIAAFPKDPSAEVDYSALTAACRSIALRLSGDTRRQNGSTVLSHFQDVAEHTMSMLHPEWHPFGEALGLLHDLKEDYPDKFCIYRSETEIGKNMIVLEDELAEFFPASHLVCKLVHDITHSSAADKSYKFYTERIFNFNRTLSDKPYDEQAAAAILLVGKLADRISNTSRDEVLDPDAIRADFKEFQHKLKAACDDLNSSEAQDALFEYYKKKDVLFFPQDVGGHPLEWYRDNRLLADPELFLKGAQARFQLKKVSNAQDNIDFFLPRFEKALLHDSPWVDYVIDSDKVRRTVHNLYVTSIKILEDAGKFHDESYTSSFRSRLRQREFDYGRKLNIFPQLMLYRVAERSGALKVFEPGTSWDTYREPLDAETAYQILTPAVSKHVALPQRSLGTVFYGRSLFRGKKQLEFRPLRKGENIADWAKQAALSFHNPHQKRGIGRTQLAHLETIVKTSAPLVDENFRTVAVAAVWLHDALDEMPEIHTTLRRYLLNAKREERELLINILDILKQKEGETNTNYIQRVFQWDRDNPPAENILAGLIKFTERLDELQEIHKANLGRLGKNVKKIRKSLIDSIDPIDFKSQQEAKFSFYWRTGMFFTHHSEPLYDEQGNLTVDMQISEDELQQLHGARLIHHANEALGVIIPSLEERALYAGSPETLRAGHGVFCFDALWDTVWRSYAMCFDILSECDAGGIASINEWMRGRANRDRSYLVELYHGFRPISSIMRRLWVLGQYGLAGFDGKTIVGPDDWRIPHPPISGAELNEPFCPWHREDASTVH